MWACGKFLLMKYRVEQVKWDRRFGLKLLYVNLASIKKAMRCSNLVLEVFLGKECPRDRNNKLFN